MSDRDDGSAAELTAPIGVDEWVARSGDRRECRATGVAAASLDAAARAAGLVAAAGAGRGLLGLSSPSVDRNVNIQQVGFNAVLYAMLALGLNIAVGWAGPARPRLRRLLRLRRLRLRDASPRRRSAPTAAAAPTCRRSRRSRSCSSPPASSASSSAWSRCGSPATTSRSSRCSSARRSCEVVNNVDPSTLGGVNGLFGLDPLHTSAARSRPRSATTTSRWIVLLVLMALLAPARHLAHRPRLARGPRRPARRRRR